MSLSNQRTDFSIIEFDRIIQEKGYDLLHQKATLCSCVDELGETNLVCPLCSNTGFRYALPAIKIKAILTGMSKDKDLSETGLTQSGMVNVTTYAKHRLAFADRLTLLEGKLIYSEVISDLTLTPTLKYPIIDADSVDSVMSIHKQYVIGVDYEINQGQLVWLKPVNESFSIRYVTYPVFLILNFPNSVRGTITKLKSANLTYADLPIKATARLEFVVGNNG